jgi:hypothetical protein
MQWLKSKTKKIATSVLMSALNTQCFPVLTVSIETN